jgi:hypothetical protein
MSLSSTRVHRLAAATLLSMAMGGLLSATGCGRPDQG